MMLDLVGCDSNEKILSVQFILTKHIPVSDDRLMWPGLQQSNIETHETATDHHATMSPTPT